MINRNEGVGETPIPFNCTVLYTKQGDIFLDF